MLIFSIGPVQGFIAQSRRTADGWVGSYLLSYLVCTAAINLENHGEVVEPYLKNIPLYKALRNDPGNPVAPDDDLTIAGLPNNILVELKENVSAFDAGEQASKAVKKAWEDVATAIWNRLPVTSNQKSAFELAWKRQTSCLWETYWAWGANSTAAFHALAARKGVRDFPAVEEHGDRCTLCGEREALWDRQQRDRENTARDATVRFWRELAERQKPKGLIKPGGKERLCAPCLVKRCIPWVKDDENEIRKLWGEEDVVFPSTSTMATLLTKADLVRRAYREGDLSLKGAVEDYVAKLKRYVQADARPADPWDAFMEWKEALGGLTGDLWKKAEGFVRLDGDWLLYGEGVRNELDIKPDVHQSIEAAHRALLSEMRRTAVPPPPIYWAVLTMDGDRMGKLKETFPDEGLEISRRINEFAQEVRPIMTKWNGRLVYAGGDDVLAFFPVKTALDAAEELRSAFPKRFSDWLADKSERKDKLERANVQPPTLSGSIIYAHHQAPLGALIHRGHVLLSEWAKGRAGRNALAVEVRGRAGAHLTFADRWVDCKGRSLKERINAVVTLLEEEGVASRFLYSLRGSAHLMGRVGPMATHEQRKAYIASLLQKTRLGAAPDAGEVAEKLLALCGEPELKCLRTDPLTFARFLSTGGREDR